SDMINFVMNSIRKVITKTVGPYDGAGMNDRASSNFSAGIKSYIGVKSCPFFNRSSRENAATRVNSHRGANFHIGPDKNMLSNITGRINGDKAHLPAIYEIILFLNFSFKVNL